MSNTNKKSIIISSKFFWYTKELIPYLEEIDGLKTHIYKKNLFLKIEQIEILDYFRKILRIINYDPDNHEKLEKPLIPISFSFNLMLFPEITIPGSDWEQTSKNIRKLMELLKETNKNFPKLNRFIQIILSGISRNIRIIGNNEHPLKLFIESIVNYNNEVAQILELYNPWINMPEGKQWGLENLSEDSIYLPYGLFVHLYRIPIDDNSLIETYLKEWFDFLKSKGKTYLVTDLPLLSPKRRRFPVIQCLMDEKDLESVSDYWRFFSSLILRTLGYTVTKISLVKGKEASKEKMLLALFNKKIQSNFDKFIDSCINPSVTSSYRQYKKIFDSDFHYKRYSEFYTIYRGGVLEKKYKKAEQELIKNPRNKDHSRRVNRRRRYLVDFIVDFFDVYGYLAFEGVFLFKYYKSIGLKSKMTIYDFVKEKWNRREKILSQSTDPSDFPNTYITDEEINERFKWIISAHKLKGFIDSKMIESIT
ncbi:MAG: hypothetical protein ACW981_08540 [Candidatus Hodarchaeales archaeon]